MRIPNDEQCQGIIKELTGEPSLTQYERNWLESNQLRTQFTGPQKEWLRELVKRYDLKSFSA